MNKHIVIMAGGTGGHVFPALAVAKYLQTKNWNVSWIGTKQGMESKVLATHGIEFDWLSIGGLRGKPLLTKMYNILLLIKAFWKAYKILHHRQPNVVLGMGGYVSGPGGIMAKCMGITLLIHEQNKIPGTTNRLLVKVADKILEAFPGSFLPQVNAVFTGNPLRTQFLGLAKTDFWTKDCGRRLKILVLGGSQGANILNTIIPDTVAKLTRVEIKHQTGKADFISVDKKYKSLSIKAQVFKFIDDIVTEYKWADMVICRAGAMTVSEISAVGLPAIFIPLPSATDNHQVANARYLVDANAGLMILQNNLHQESLLKAINTLKVSLKKIGTAVKNQAKLDATTIVAELCITHANR